MTLLIFEYLIIGFLGLCVGSFLNVVILRFDNLSSIISTRSHCPNCKKNIAWYDLFPLISYLFLRAKCRTCKKQISWQYPLVEAATAAIFILLFWQFGLSWNLLFLAVIASILIILSIYDFLKYEIPDVLSYLAIAVSIGFVFYKLSTAGQLGLIASWLDYGYAILVSAGFLGFLVLISWQKWMGAGDIFVGVVMGLILGFYGTVVSMFLAFFTGALFGIGLLVFRQKNLKGKVPFAPFLVLGTFLSLFLGNLIINWYLGLII